MVELLRIRGTHQLRRLDIWLVLAVGWVMIGTFTLLLYESTLLSQLAEIGGVANLLQRGYPGTPSGTLHQLMVHVARSGLLLVHAGVLIQGVLILVGDPFENPRFLHPFLALPLARWKIYLAQVLTSFFVVGLFLLLFALPAVFNAYLAGVFQLEVGLGVVCIGLKLGWFIGCYRFFREFLGIGAGTLLALFFYLGSHYHGVLVTLAGSLRGIWSTLSQVAALLLPPLDRLSYRSLTVYGDQPALVIVDLSIVLLYLALFFGLSLFRFRTRDAI